MASQEPVNLADHLVIDNNQARVTLTPGDHVEVGRVEYKMVSGILFKLTMNGVKIEAIKLDTEQAKIAQVEATLEALKTNKDKYLELSK